MRFYAELNDFLPKGPGGGTVTREFDVPGSVKDMIESCGIPHTEVDLIIANGESVDFDYQVHDGVFISVYPVFESFDIGPIVKVRPDPLRTISFVADVHLGRLARYLRMLGLDTLYDKDWEDATLAQISSREGRILLTRDLGLLKHSVVTHGYYVRATDPRRQVVEVARRFHLEADLEPFTRCTICNGRTSPVDKSEIADRLPSATYQHVEEYRQCSSCEKVYWRGAHHLELDRIVEAVRSPDSHRVRSSR